MIRLFCISTLVAPLAMQVQAETASFEDLMRLPPEVAEHVIALEAHGDRFAPAIRAILAEADKPSWGFAGCDHTSDTGLPALPES